MYTPILLSFPSSLHLPRSLCLYACSWENIKSERHNNSTTSTCPPSLYISLSTSLKLPFSLLHLLLLFPSPSIPLLSLPTVPWNPYWKNIDSERRSDSAASLPLPLSHSLFLHPSSPSTVSWNSYWKNIDSERRSNSAAQALFQ